MPRASRAVAVTSMLRHHAGPMRGRRGQIPAPARPGHDRGPEPSRQSLGRWIERLGHDDHHAVGSATLLGHADDRIERAECRAPLRALHLRRHLAREAPGARGVARVEHDKRRTPVAPRIRVSAGEYPLEPPEVSRDSVRRTGCVPEQPGRHVSVAHQPGEVHRGDRRRSRAPRPAPGYPGVGVPNGGGQPVGVEYGLPQRTEHRIGGRPALKLLSGRQAQIPDLGTVHPRAEHPAIHGLGRLLKLPRSPSRCTRPWPRKSGCAQAPAESPSAPSTGDAGSTRLAHAAA